MRKQLLLISLGLTAFTSLTSLFVSLSPSLGQSNSSSSSAASQPDKVTFFCQPIFDRASGEKIPATVAWVPEQKKRIRFIAWKSEYFNKSGWTPAERCQKVSEKFQEFYEQGRLNYLSSGKNNGYPIICGLTNQGETCNGNNQLFTVKTGSNPAEVIQIITDIAQGKNGDPLIQSAEGQLYISVQDFLKNAPPIEQK